MKIKISNLKAQFLEKISGKKDFHYAIVTSILTRRFIKNTIENLMSEQIKANAAEKKKKKSYKCYVFHKTCNKIKTKLPVVLLSAKKQWYNIPAL